MKVAMIGPYPPPYGGVATHIQRLKDALDRKGIECVVYDESKGAQKNPRVFPITRFRWWFPIYFLTGREDIMHCHCDGWRWRACISLLTLRGRKVLLAYHNERFPQALGNEYGMIQRIIMAAAKRATLHIVDTDSNRDKLAALGIQREKIVVIPEFIPPYDSGGAPDEPLPPYVTEFMSAHKPIVSAGAFQLMFHKGEDLYGLDLLIELIARLKPSYPDVGLVFCLPCVGENEYFERIRDECKRLAITDNVLFITEPLDEVYPVWQRSDLFIRPTNTDGNAMSIHEALYLRVPSLASDCVVRPEACALFRTRDIDDLTEKAQEILGHLDIWKEKVGAAEVKDNSETFIAAYEACMESKAV